MAKSEMKKRAIRVILFLIIFTLMTACVPDVEKLKAAGDVEKLIEIIETGDTPTSKEDAPYKAAQALGELGDKRAIKPLIKSLDYDLVSKEDGNFYYDAVKDSLILIGEKGIDEIIDYLVTSQVLESDEMRAILIRDFLIEIGPVSVSPLLEAVKDNPSVDSYVLGIFMAYGPSIKPTLVEALDPDEQSLYMLFIRKALNHLEGYTRIADAASAVCNGSTIPGAPDFSPNLLGTHPLYIIGKNMWLTSWSGATIHDDWKKNIPAGWLADTPENLQVVICFNEIWDEVEVCKYSAGFIGRATLKRGRIRMKGEMFAASNGELLGTFDFLSDDPEECPPSITTVSGAEKRTYKEIPFSYLRDWLRDHGIQMQGN